MLPEFPKTSPLRRFAFAITGFAAAAGLLLLAGCPAAPPKTTSTPLPAATPAAPVRWSANTVRRELCFIPLDLPVIVAGTRVSIGSPVKMVSPDDLSPFPSTQPADNSADNPAADPRIPQPADWPQENLPAVYSVHLVRGFADGPLAEQLTGSPRASADGGSFLVPLDNSVSTPAPPPKPKATATAPADSAISSVPSPIRTFEVKEPMPLFVQLSIPPTMDPGEYRFPIHLSVPGKPPEDALFSVQVADLTEPTQPRVLALATTSMAELSRIYPESFGNIVGERLDRADPDQKSAIDQLDTLVNEAHRQGIALFVEDAAPQVRVDEVGHVSLDWDAYDRLMQPYMDGSAFIDRVPMPVWLAPVPPRRIRDSGTQLWQYIDACARHFSTKAWIGTPAFLHTALADPELPEDAGETPPDPQQAAQLRSLVSDMLRLHMPRDMLAVATPDAVSLGVPHGELWSVNDSDPRLPPAGSLSTESSLRAWPWVCIARDRNGATGPLEAGSVKGFVWRDALATDRQVQEDPTRRPLFVISNGAPLPALRMAYLHEGLSDAALLGMLEQQTDPSAKGENILAEMLAGMIGRTGLAADDSAPPSATRPAESIAPQLFSAPDAAPGFLYAGWPGNRAAWIQATAMLQKLVLAGDPGRRASIKPDDPDYLAAKIWLSQTRRPVARVAGYTFSMRPGRDSDILDARLRLRIDNPIDASADVDLRFNDLPGDFDLPPEAASPAADLPVSPADADLSSRRRNITIAPGAAGEIALRLAGHVESLLRTPPPGSLDLTEHFAGAAVRLPVQFPIYRMHATATPPKPDGDPADWPPIAEDTQTRVFGEMIVANRYLSRPDMSAGIIRRDSTPAIVRWTYDRDNLYLLARCPQDAVSDERNTAWPTIQTGAGENPGSRWWGTDGLQIELSAMPPTAALTASPGQPAQNDPFNRVVKIAFKPAGVMMVQTAELSRDPKTGQTQITWHDGAPPAPSAPNASANIRYGIALDRKDGHPSGYTVEAAIPRAWLDPPNINQSTTRAPAWRLNILRHRASDLTSTSWSGPLVDDNDLAMMGALLGE